jgi:hypothetical protein
MLYASLQHGNSKRISVGKLERKRPFEKSRLKDRRTILKWILEK